MNFRESIKVKESALDLIGLGDWLLIFLLEHFTCLMLLKLHLTLVALAKLHYSGFVDVLYSYMCLLV